MSFILDAVKKSEQERRLAQSENLQSWYYQPVRKQEDKIPWIAVLVIVNSLVLIALFAVVLKPQWVSDPEPAPENQQMQRQSESFDLNQPAVEVPQQDSADISVRKYAQETQPQDIQEPEIIAPGQVYEDQVDEVIMPASRDRLVNQVAEPQGPVTDLEELPESILIHIPAIGFSSHLYSSAAQARQIVVNGQKLHEGDYLNQDLQLLKIEEKSVIFQQFQYPFRVYVSRYWVR